MTIFLFSLAGIPPFAGLVRQVRDVPLRARRRHTAPAVILGVIAAVISVIAFFYYARVVRKMWFDQPAEGVDATVQIPAALMVAIGICAAIVVVVGVYPQFFAHIGELAFA